MISSNLMDAAEACYESDPTPQSEKWIEKMYNNLYNTSSKKGPCTTLVQHQNGQKWESEGKE